MLPDSDIFSYQSLKNKEAAELIVQRESVVRGSGKIEEIRFERESLEGVNLANAPLFFEDASEPDQLLEDLKERLEEEGIDNDVLELEDYDYTDDAEIENAQTLFLGCRMPAANFSRCRAQFSWFYMSDLSFSSFADADLRAANFQGARLTAVDFEGARLDYARFTITPELLTANFSGATGIEQARFYMIDKKGVQRRVTGVCIDSDGRLAVAEKSARKDFGRDSKETVPFSRLYDDLKRTADQQLSTLTKAVREAQAEGRLPKPGSALSRLLAPGLRA